MEVESANTTGWSALKYRLRTTKADVLLAQETLVKAKGLAEASQWAYRHGWKSIWAIAGEGASGKAAFGGVAIFARREIGLRLPIVGSRVVCDARGVMAVIEAPGHRSTIYVSVLSSRAGLVRTDLGHP